MKTRLYAAPAVKGLIASEILHIAQPTPSLTAMTRCSGHLTAILALPQQTIETMIDFSVNRFSHVCLILIMKNVTAVSACHPQKFRSVTIGIKSLTLRMNYSLINLIGLQITPDICA